ncbi:hypothetical protein KGF57_003666 [Candida theae]|uniref:Uncharacterized protein n=1 Tax=Candida theae TaxID=1198502 RepID=A0AAD5FXP6_9ASCO|nr:uncharacterized protein KGF57_003666 [Candida theae]KAI5955533.1 hypothetical protein KGF57_003666 [Candida theae]
MSGSLSTRVMNMKFMQKADSPKVNEGREEEKRTLKDVSEWSLPHSAKVLKMASHTPKVEVLGYGSILNDRNYTTRKFQAPNDKEVLGSGEQQHETRELSNLWKKRKPDGSPDRGQKRRAI